MPPPQFLLFPTTVSRLHGALTTRWNYLHGNPSQIGSALATLLPIALKGLRSLSRFLNPSPGSSSQIAAFRVIAGVLEPTLEWHRYETLKQLDVRLAAYLYLADSADSSQPPLLAEERALALQQNVEGERDVITAAPLGGSSSRDEFDGPATQSVLKALVALKKHPLLRELELQLMQVWTPAERYPAEVFRLTLASRSWTCVSILFGHLSGVKEAGTIYAILEQASQERSYYFSVKLSVEDDESDRPDHTRWFTYPTLLDKAVRSPDFAQLAKFNLFGFGAQIRQLKEEVVASALDSPPPGTEFNAEQFFYHLTLLSFIAFWLEALGFTLEGKAGFAAAFNALSVFCQNGAHYRGSVLESHVSNMRRLYLALQQDMHSSFQCFFPKRQSAFDQFVEVDAMFLPSGNFYSTLRLLKDDVKHLNKLSRLGVIASPSTPLLQTDAGSNKKSVSERHTFNCYTLLDRAHRARPHLLSWYMSHRSLPWVHSVGLLRKMLVLSKFSASNMLKRRFWRSSVFRNLKSVWRPTFQGKELQPARAQHTQGMKLWIHHSTSFLRKLSHFGPPLRNLPIVFEVRELPLSRCLPPLNEGAVDAVTSAGAQGGMPKACLPSADN